jgi:hypothetical protein
MPQTTRQETALRDRADDPAFPTETACHTEHGQAEERKRPEETEIPETEQKCHVIRIKPCAMRVQSCLLPDYREWGRRKRGARSDMLTEQRYFSRGDCS